VSIQICIVTSQLRVRCLPPVNALEPAIVDQFPGNSPA
jgi:hypothetical protein